VWINEARPAYRRAAASRSEGYHMEVGVALALAPLAVEPAKEHGLLTALSLGLGRGDGPVEAAAFLIVGPSANPAPWSLAC
jgi:hypothetical protein